MKSKYANRIRPLCETQPDSQSLSFECPKVKENINIQGRYEDIFAEKIPPSTVKTLVRIMKFRENQPFDGPRAFFNAAE